MEYRRWSIQKSEIFTLLFRYESSDTKKAIQKTIRGFNDRLNFAAAHL